MARHPAGLAAEAVPLVLAGTALVCAGAALVVRSPLLLLLGGGVVYLLPPLLHRLHERLAPLEAGVHAVVGPHYLPWWGSHQLQRLFIVLPVLEDLLHLVPGAFSVWLRLWGARVGRGVVWSPGTRIFDRSLLEVGDGAILGFGVEATSHLLTHRRGSLVVVLKPVRVGAGALVGAKAKLGPGAKVPAGAVIKALAVVTPLGRPE